MKDDAAEICAVESWVLERKNVIVESAEGSMWPMLHPVIEGVDYRVLEVGSAGVRGDNRLTLVVAEAVVAASGHVHASPGLHQEYLRVHVFGNARGRVKSDRGPHFRDVQFRNGMGPQKVTGGVGAVDFERSPLSRYPSVRPMSWNMAAA